ncbi:MAG: DUF4920 domain-containing protein [Sphingobacteriia bacterium]|nr:DUF4920 domain-containing protein [Sphingobacteriia bacterium]
MKKITISLLLLIAVTAVNAQPPQVPAVAGSNFGAVVSDDKALPAETLPALLAKSEKLDTKIKAKVIDVCPKKGCWLKLQVNDTTTAFVKMKDYAFFLPLEIKGKTILLDGEASLVTTSVDELKHYAEDAKKSRAEIDAITQPKKEIRLVAKGIKVVG